jgi:hypothetical protein
MRRRGFVTGVVAVAVLAGCGGGGEKPAGTPQIKITHVSHPGVYYGRTVRFEGWVRHSDIDEVAVEEDAWPYGHYRRVATVKTDHENGLTTFEYTHRPQLNSLVRFAAPDGSGKPSAEEPVYVYPLQHMYPQLKSDRRWFLTAATDVAPAAKGNPQPVYFYAAVPGTKRFRLVGSSQSRRQDDHMVATLTTAAWPLHTAFLYCTKHAEAEGMGMKADPTPHEPPNCGAAVAKPPD